jgi:hypothetical protein
MYLLAIGAFQLVLYLLLSISEQASVLFYFDPRFGLFFLETILRGSERMPSLLGWLSAIVIIALGWLVFTRERFLALYFGVEFLLAGPSILTFIFVAAANLSPNHGFSVGELVFPGTTFIFVTVIPVIIGVGSLLTREKVDTLNYIPK